MLTESACTTCDGCGNNIACAVQCSHCACMLLLPLSSYRSCRQKTTVVAAAPAGSADLAVCADPALQLPLACSAPAAAAQLWLAAYGALPCRSTLHSRAPDPAVSQACSFFPNPARHVTTHPFCPWSNNPLHPQPLPEFCPKQTKQVAAPSSAPSPSFTPLRRPEQSTQRSSDRRLASPQIS